MTMCAGAVLLRSLVVIPRLVMLLELRGYRRFSRAFGSFRYRSPQNSECGAQRNEL